MRTVMARLNVDDDELFERHDGVIDGVWLEIRRLNDCGIFLDDAFIADDDETEKWFSYVNYVANWCFDSPDEDSSPLSYKDWRGAGLCY